MKLNDILLESKQPKLITEGWNDPKMTLLETTVIQPWVRDVEKYLMEANLTADQINQLFMDVEKGVSASGKNRTAIGKAKDVAGLPIDAVKWIDKKINELGKLAQDAGPVKNADAKFEELKKKIGEKDSKVVNAVKAVSNWAKENPGKASIAVGILTAAAALAAGPLGGAVAGFLARATKDLLQGEKLSTAVGKSIKTAAYGALAGLAIRGLTDAMIDNIATGSEAEANAMMDGFEKANFKAAVDSAAADAGLDAGVLDGAMNFSSDGNINGFFYNYDFTMTPEQVAEYKQLFNATTSVKAFSPEYYEAAGRLHGFLSTAQQANADLTALARTVADIPKDMLTGDQMDAAIAVLDNADAAIEKVMDIGGGAAAAAQGALATVDDNNKNMHKIKPIDPKEKEQLELSLKGGGEAKAEAPKESKVYKGKKLSEGQVYLLFNRLDVAQGYIAEMIQREQAQRLDEGPLDALKGLGKKVKSGIGKAVGAAKNLGKQVTTKVTAEKLNTAWKKAGSPTDSEELYKFLMQQGVSKDVVAPVYDTMKLPVPKTAEPAADEKEKDTTTSAGDDTSTDTTTNTTNTTTDTTTDKTTDTTTTSGGDAGGGSGNSTTSTTDTGSNATTDTTGKQQTTKKTTKVPTKKIDISQLAAEIKDVQPDITKDVINMIKGVEDTDKKVAKTVKKSQSKEKEVLPTKEKQPETNQASV